MHNQHAGLSQVLADQRITDQHNQATHARLVRGARSPRRRDRRWGSPWPVAAGPLASHRHQPANPSPAQQQLIDRRRAMSKLTRALILGATLAAMHLVDLTTVAHAQANHDPDGKDARRLPALDELAARVADLHGLARM
jgi:hypothetical protein